MNAPIHTKRFKSASAAIARDAKSGRVLPLKGYGSMKGEFVVTPGVDLCKPIAPQVLRGSGKRA